MIIFTKLRDGQVVKPNQLPLEQSREKCVWANVGEGEDLDVTRSSGGGISVERVLCSEDTGEWYGSVIDPNSVTEDLELFYA